MSKAGTKDQPQGWKAEAGSRRWFWQMRLLNFTLWVTPLLTAIVCAQAAGVAGVKDPSVFARMVHVVPWFVVGVVAATFAHALWRIEVNMEGNSAHPYTDKDAAIFNRATWIQAIAGVVVVLGGLGGVPTYMLLTHMKDSEVLYGDAVYGPMVTIALLGMMTKTTQTLYKRGRQAYEELEKGV